MAEHMTVCGGHLSAYDDPTQLFSHAKFGDVNYENKEDCDWIIEAPEGKNVHLQFTMFELEDEKNLPIEPAQACRCQIRSSQFAH